MPHEPAHDNQRSYARGARFACHENIRVWTDLNDMFYSLVPRGLYIHEVIM